MRIDVVVPVTRRRTVDRLLYSFSRNTTEPDLITLVSNELAAADLHTYGLNVRLLRLRSDFYPIGSMDVVLRRNAGIWASEASHVITFDDDQLAPPDLIEASRALLAARRYFWGHHRYIEFSRWSVDEVLRLPADAGRPREFPPNAWHSPMSAYAGLFGAERSLLLEVGGFDMLFSGRHGGEDQNLGRRMAALMEGGNMLFVYEPPFAWHPEQNSEWDENRYSNVCAGNHEIVIGKCDGIHRCVRCPFYWVPEELLSHSEIGSRFNPANVEITIEQVPPRGPVSNIAQLGNRISGTVLDALTAALREPFQVYTERVSPPEMAISLRTAAFLWALCDQLKPAAILDLGSGFSSLVFRTYAVARGETSVWSSDDDLEWLRQTASFLASQQLPTDNLVPWSQLPLHVGAGSFDLVFHDLGSMYTQLATLRDALRYSSIGGVVILDDMHKEEYGPYADIILRAEGWSWRTIRKHTLDHFGRFCGIALRE